MYLSLAAPIGWPLNLGPLRGLGDQPVSTIAETGAGAALLTAAPFTGPAAPFVAAAGVIADLLASMGVGSGCGQTCVLSTEYANQADAALQQNIQTYFSLPVPRDPAARAAALQNFQTLWNDFVTQASNPSLGSAGQNAISERQAGGCQWKQPASSVPPWGTPPAGACWNWWNGYHDPIANDPNVAAPTVASTVETGASSVESVGTAATTALGISSNYAPYLIGGAALLALALIL